MNKKYLRVEKLTKRFKNNIVLNNISFSLEKNKIMGLQGINGSGKTMLLRAISGLIKIQGEISIDNIDIKSKEYNHDIGVLIEQPSFLNEFSGIENLELLSLIQSGISRNDIIKALNEVGLDPNDKRRYKKYSLGMKQRLGVAQAILGSPKLILLDEPTNGIDAEGIYLLCELMQTLKNRGSTLIIASHDKEFLNAVADETYYIEGGELIC